MLITKFLETKLAWYVPPDRKARALGSRVAFSREKYHASLVSLTSLRQADAAKLVGVSHSLLRKWLTEERFEVQLYENAEAFAIEYFVPFVRKSFRAELDELERLLAGPVETIANYTRFEREYPELADAQLYGDYLILRLPDLVRDALHPGIPMTRIQDWSSEELALWVFASNVVDKLLARRNGRTMHRTRLRRAQERIQESIRVTLSLLSRPDFDEHTRKVVAYLLREIELSLDQKGGRNRKRRKK